MTKAIIKISNQTLKRALFGSLYVFLVFFSIKTGGFNLLMWGFCGMCIWEFLNLSKTKFFVDINLGFIIFLLVQEYLFQGDELYGILSFVLFILICFFRSLFSNFSHLEKIRQLSNVFFAWIYIGIPSFLAIYLYTHSSLAYRNKLFLSLFIFIWFNDTFGYIAGKKWGKKKWPIYNISPNKTIIGYLSGIIASLIAGLFFFFLWKDFYWLLLGLIVPILGSIGDLLESMIKRAYGVKDSSNWFPGHGGFLDRLDSFIFVVPFIFIIENLKK